MELNKELWSKIIQIMFILYDWDFKGYLFNKL